MVRSLLTIALTVATILIALLLPVEDARLVLGMTLAVIGGVYFGFAVADDRPALLTIESAQMVVFFAVAYGGVRVSWWFLVGGYFAHGFWDLAHHPRGVPTRVPRWYIPACIVYDWIVGTFIVMAYCLGLRP